MQVKFLLLSLVLILLLFFNTSCMHTWNGFHSYYPDSCRDTDDCKYHLGTVVHGASGSAYNDETPKTIVVYIDDDNGVRKFRKIYKVTAASLKVNTEWKEANKVEMEMYDYAGADDYRSEIAGIPIVKRPIFTLKLSYDPEEEVFVEEAAIEHAHDSNVNSRYKDNSESRRKAGEWGMWFYGKAINFPPESTFENQQFRLYCEYQWPESKKKSWASNFNKTPATSTVAIGIWDSSRKWEWMGAKGDDLGCKFKKEYLVREVSSKYFHLKQWDVKWDSLNNLVIQIYDYGDGISAKKAKEANLPKRPILLLRYTYDAEQDKFVEIEAKHLYQPDRSDASIR